MTEPPALLIQGQSLRHWLDEMRSADAGRIEAANIAFCRGASTRDGRPATPEEEALALARFLGFCQFLPEICQASILWRLGQLSAVLAPCVVGLIDWHSRASTEIRHAALELLLKSAPSWCRQLPREAHTVAKLLLGENVGLLENAGSSSWRADLPYNFAGTLKSLVALGEPGRGVLDGLRRALEGGHVRWSSGTKSFFGTLGATVGLPARALAPALLFTIGAEQCPVDVAFTLFDTFDTLKPEGDALLEALLGIARSHSLEESVRCRALRSLRCYGADARVGEACLDLAESASRPASVRHAALLSLEACKLPERSRASLAALAALDGCPQEMRDAAVALGRKLGAPQSPNPDENGTHATGPRISLLRGASPHGAGASEDNPLPDAHSIRHSRLPKIVVGPPQYDSPLPLDTALLGKTPAGRLRLLGKLQAVKKWRASALDQELARLREELMAFAEMPPLEPVRLGSKGIDLQERAMQALFELGPATPEVKSWLWRALLTPGVRAPIRAAALQRCELLLPDLLERIAALSGMRLENELPWELARSVDTALAAMERPESVASSVLREWTLNPRMPLSLRKLGLEWWVASDGWCPEIEAALRRSATEESDDWRKVVFDTLETAAGSTPSVQAFLRSLLFSRPRAEGVLLVLACNRPAGPADVTQWRSVQLLAMFRGN